MQVSLRSRSLERQVNGFLLRALYQALLTCEFLLPFLMWLGSSDPNYLLKITSRREVYKTGD